MDDQEKEEILRQRHERKMQLQRERRQRQREARERPETAQESGIEKQLRLIAESSLKQDESDEDDMLEDEENYATELDLVNGSYGREIRDMFQQIEDPEERARLRRARRAHMQRIRRKRIRDQAAVVQNTSGISGQRSIDGGESESASRSIASSPGILNQEQMLSLAEKLKLEKQRADTRERQRRRRARLSLEKREQELEAGRERQRRRRARLGMEQKEQEREDSRLRMQKRRALLAGGVLRFGDLSDQEDLGSDVKEGDKIDLERNGRKLDDYGSDLSDNDQDLIDMYDDEKNNGVSVGGKFATMDENAFTLLLIKRISEEPSLYDITDENYTNDNLRHRAFMRIQERLEREGATLPQATSVRDKFRILKRRFISEHEKYGNESKWSLYKPLMFMIPYVEATNLRKRKPLTFKRKLGSPAPQQNDRLDVKSFLENLSKVQLKFQDEYSRASSSNQFDEYDSKLDSEEKRHFNSMFRLWLASHPTSPICNRQQFQTILNALRQKKRGQEFNSNQMDEYNLACRFVLQGDGTSPIIISKTTEKQIISEDDVYDIIQQVHLNTNHGRLPVLSKRLVGYNGLAETEIILLFLKCCKQCELTESAPQLQRSGSFYENSLDGENSNSNNYNLSMFLNPEQSHPQNGKMNRLSAAHFDSMFATDLNEADIDALLKSDRSRKEEERLTSFKTYGKSETEWRLFRRIMFRPTIKSEFKRTNYVQCKACGKLLVAKLTGGSNPARHRKHCKGSQQYSWQINSIPEVPPQTSSTFSKGKQSSSLVRSVDRIQKEDEVSLPSFMDQLINLGNSILDNDNKRELKTVKASFDIRSLVERKLNRKIISDGEKLKVLGTKMYPPDRCANRGFNIRRLESDNELQFVAYSSETDGFYCKSCILFSFRESRFVSRPFTFFKAFFSAGNGWPKHAKSKYHKSAYQTTLEFLASRHFNYCEDSEKTNGTLPAVKSNSNQSPSHGSSNSNNEYEIPALFAYRIRQTYIFMRVLKTNKAVLCKANDEDFFPPHRSNTTAADRASWTAGQIITAYFDFDQKETECVIEAVGDREVVQEYFQNVIIQEAVQQRKGPSSSLNGVQNDLNPAIRQLIFPPQQNGQVEEIVIDENEDIPPRKLPRLDPGYLNNKAIVERFEKLERRLLAIERQQGCSKNDHKEESNEEIEVQVDGDRYPLKDVPSDVLREEVEQYRDKLMDDEPLTINDRKVYDEFRLLDFIDDLKEDVTSFGLKVLSLLIDEETFRHSQMPSLVNGKGGTSTEDHLLNSEVVDAYKKLLDFMGGSAICEDSKTRWLNSIQSSLHKNSDYPQLDVDPLYSMEAALGPGKRGSSYASDEQEVF